MSNSSDRTVRLAQAIRAQRENVARSQEDVAHDADVSVRHYQKIESGVSDPKISTLLRIADALGTKLQKLLDRAEEQRPRKR